MLKNVKPIGITPNRVTEIPVESKELTAGQVKFEPAKKPRPIAAQRARRIGTCGGEYRHMGARVSAQ